MRNKCFRPIVARYSKSEAEKLLKVLKKSPKLSIQKRKPTYKVSREEYRGKLTDRWIISQDCESLNSKREVNSF